jgi:peptide-methionine (S)-S-oxide reductase
MRVRLRFLRSGLLAAAALGGCADRGGAAPGMNPEPPPGPRAPSGRREIATLGAGCFWCVEAVFRELKGVQSVVPGYAGGDVPNPTYEQVCTGRTGHAEVAQISFDPGLLSYDELLEVFWATHDPTTKDRQGNDVGPQYRSIILWHDEDQRRRAERAKQRLNETEAFGRPVVTEIVKFEAFYPAEVDHVAYYERNPVAPYCLFVIRPKMDKFRKAFKDRLQAPAPVP